MKPFTIFLALLALTVSLSVASDTPQRIHYQGVLRDSSDRPISGTVAMRFRFYDAPVGGNVLWEEDYGNLIAPGITASSGLFAVALGDPTHHVGGILPEFTDAFKDYTDVYLALVVGSDPEMTPRIKVLSSAYALNAQHLGGKHTSEFIDIGSTPQIKWSQLTLNASGSASGFGVEAYGPTAGGLFRDSVDSGYAYVGAGNRGIEAHGSWMGGYFRDSDQSGYANVAYGDFGIEGWGNNTGGYFADSDNSGRAYVGYWDYGVYAMGNYAAGYFQDWDSSGQAYAAYGDFGVLGYGNSGGGLFQDLDSSGYAYVGHGDTGIEAYGVDYGGHFDNSSGSYAYAATQDNGVDAGGDYAGAVFRETDGSGYAHIAYNDEGLYAWGSLTGGNLQDIDSGNFAYVSYSSYKIWGSGAVSFVQNHPYDKSQVIVYAAPEGDEVATYTRGAARLADGEAHVSLGETFKWVTNPDIGLTAHLTPHGDCNGLYVESLTTSELVVKELGGGTGNVAFDYIVYGLRIGFEESSVVQTKQQESYIPSMKDHRDLYGAQPELQSYNSLERFKKMRADMGVGETLDLSASVALKSAIHEYDSATDPPACALSRTGHCPERTPAHATEPRPLPSAPAVAPPGRTDATSTALLEPRIPTHGGAPSDARKEASPEPEAAPVDLFPVSEPVEIGDLLTLDPLNPGQFQKGRTAADRNVVGIVAAEPVLHEGQWTAPLIETHFGVANVDASYGAILPGDLLVTSATPGHAMKAPDVYANGSVIGKALEPMEAGTGQIKVLVMLR